MSYSDKLRQKTMQWPADLAASAFWRDFSSFYKTIASVGIAVFAKNGQWHHQATAEHLPYKGKTAIKAKIRGRCQ